MSEKKKLFDIEETRLAYDAAVLLRQVADALVQGKCEMDGQEIVLAAPSRVEVSASGKCKEKDGGTKCKIEVEISWFSPAVPAAASEE